MNLLVNSPNDTSSLFSYNETVEGKREEKGLEVESVAKVENDSTSLKPIDPAKNEIQLKIQKSLMQYRTNGELLGAATNYLMSSPHFTQQAPVLDPATFSYFPSDDKMIETLLKDFQGFCVGEAHNEVSSKKFFINNMENFKKHNIKAIGFEGIDYTEQDALDAYLNDSYQGDKVMEKRVADLLQKVRTYLGPKSDKYRDDMILEAAKKHGIRVIAIDVPSELEKKNLTLELTSFGLSVVPRTDLHIRRHLMNFAASVIMEEVISSLKDGEKYVCLMGANHVLRARGEGVDTEKVPGVADLLQCPAIKFQKTPASFPKPVPFITKSDKKFGDFTAIYNTHLKSSYL